MNITISGFKCFEEESFEIGKLTVLAGPNGGGKSSFIQALLLARLAFDKAAPNGGGEVFLNNEYHLNLGAAINLPNRKIGKIEFSISLKEIWPDGEGVENSIVFYLPGQDSNFNGLAHAIAKLLNQAKQFIAVIKASLPLRFWLNTEKGRNL